jgi:hypothetical protein
MSINALGRSGLGIDGSDLLSLAMDRNNGTPLTVSMDDFTLSKLPPVCPPMTPFGYQQSGVIPVNTDLMTIDCTQLRSVFIQCVAMGTTGVVTLYWSNDPTFSTLITAQLWSETGFVTSSITAASLRAVNVVARYLKVRLRRRWPTRLARSRQRRWSRTFLGLLAQPLSQR